MPTMSDSRRKAIQAKQKQARNEKKRNAKMASRAQKASQKAKSG